MKKKKTIKITEEQKTRLKEMLFPNGSDNANPMRQYHDSHVTADGYVDDVDGGGEPLTGDRLGRTMCKNYPFGTAYYHTAFARPLGEAEMSDLHNDEDSDSDGVEDTYNHADTNLDQFGDFNELPGSVKAYLDRLAESLNSLPEKKQLTALNYLIGKTGLKNLPPSYKKETIKKIVAK